MGLNSKEKNKEFDYGAADKIRGLIRGFTIIIMMIYLAVIFCLINVEGGSIEYYICWITMGMNTLLFAGAFAFDRWLARQMKAFQQKGKQR